MSGELHIAISAEKLFSFVGAEIANTQFTSFLVSFALIAFLLFAKTQIRHTNKLSRLQSFLEMIVESLYGLVEDITGPGAKALAFTPMIASFLLFILLNNWAEQLPGFHTITYTGSSEIRLVDAPAWFSVPKAFASSVVVEETAPAAELNEATTSESTAAEATESEGAHETEAKESAGHKAIAIFRGANADLNMTMALAIISVVMTQVIGFQYQGLHYLKKFFNFSSPIGVFIGLLELLSEFSKVVSFAFRLFGNIFAGEVLIAVITFLVPVFLPIPFIGFELFVGALQGYVFAMLSLVFFNMAASEHH